MHLRGLIIIFFWVAVIGLAYLGWRSFQSASAQAAQQVSQRLGSLPGVNWLTTQPFLRQVDHRLAQSIRAVGSGNVPGAEVLAEKIGDARETTVSATLTLTPDDIWNAWEEHGSGAVASLIGKKIEWEVAGISANAVGEARYQYCVGVVEQYKK